MLCCVKLIVKAIVNLSAWQIFRCKHQQFCIRIGFVELLAELLNDIIRNDIHWLTADTYSLHLHAGNLHLPRLACTYAVRDKRVASLHDTPDSVLLMRVQLFTHM